MKKAKLIFILLLLSASILGGLLFSFFRYQQIMYAEPITWYPTIRVFLAKNGYKVFFMDGKRIVGNMCFSRDQQLLQSWKVKTISEENVTDFLGKYLGEVIEQYGQPHGDVGSGFFCPAYVSNNAHLIVLSIDANVICKVTVKDLITNAFIAEYSIE